MARLSVLRTAIVASAIGLSIPFPAQAQPKPEQVLREVVQGMPTGERQEVQVLTATIEPGQSTPFHTHRYPVTVYVQEGVFTLEMEGRNAVTVSAGRSMVEPPNVRMTGYNRGTAPMRVVIFYVAEPGTPFLDIAHR